MAPRPRDATKLIEDDDCVRVDDATSMTKDEDDRPYKPTIQWANVFVNIFIHLGSLVGFWQLLSGQPKWQTYLYWVAIMALCNLSVCIGVHRLWSHRSFKVTRPLKLGLLFFYTMSGQTSVYKWVKIHRVHHKFAETTKDPLDFRRGFFFAHVGWYCMSYHPACQREMDRIDLKDLEADKDVMFQYNNYEIIFMSLNILSVLLPCYFWGECLWIAFWTCWVARFCVNFTQLNFTNSANHFIGHRPYDKESSATDNLAMVFLSFGEGYHNYHHAFPYDYRSGEFGDLGHYNLSGFLIDMFAKLGMVYDRKKVSPEMIARRVAKSGDGTHYLSHDHALHSNPIYGYGDKDIDDEDRKELDAMHD